jgi:uncharacterized alpha/beta hydrolase family protein
LRLSIDYINNLTIPLLGLFGNDDQNPSPEKVNQLEAELKRLGKNYEFHRYDGAGHSFWSYDRPAYRQQQAMDAWEKTFTFFDRYLKGQNNLSVCNLHQDNKTDCCLTVQVITDFVLTVLLCKPSDNFCCIFASGWWPTRNSSRTSV